MNKIVTVRINGSLYSQLHELEVRSANLPEKVRFNIEKYLKNPHDYKDKDRKVLVCNGSDKDDSYTFKIEYGVVRKGPAKTFITHGSSW